MVYIVSYDLRTPNDTPADYQQVIDAIKEGAQKWCHLQKSVWLIVTNGSASDVRNWIANYLNVGDSLFVAPISDWAARNLTKERVDWLQGQTL